ncbi:MAG: replication protein [Desulfohalobiaceae bacterium]|nr:replication protein [Desulfohalobiaceae bacterium]
MASPQLENGYLKISNELAEAFCRSMPNQASQCQVLWAIIRKTYGWQKKEDSISISQIEELTQLSRRSVIYAIQNLEAKKMIHVQRARGRGNVNKPNKISLQKNYSRWVVQEISEQYANNLKKRRERYKKSKEKVVQTNQGSANNGQKVVQTMVKNDELFAPTKKRKTIQKTLPSDFLDLSRRFLEYQQQQLGESLVKISEKKIHGGAETLEKLTRIDGFDLQREIRPALLWAVKDEFWSYQIRSIASLRKKNGSGESKFSNLYAKFKQQNPQKKVDLEW